MIRISWISPATGEQRSLTMTQDQAQEWWDAACQPVRETVSIQELAEQRAD